MGFGAGLTSYHRDGLGTMDSGHYCKMGWNHVILFPELPTHIIQEAINMLPTADGGKLTNKQSYKLDGAVNDKGLVSTMDAGSHICICI